MIRNISSPSVYKIQRPLWAFSSNILSYLNTSNGFVTFPIYVLGTLCTHNKNTKTIQF